MPISSQPASPAKKTSAAKAPVNPSGKRAENINGLFEIAAAAAIMTGQYADAAACQTHGPAVSNELAKLAEDNEKLAALFDSTEKVGPYMGLALALLPFAMQIAANHGRIDGGKVGGVMGVVDPKILEAQAKAEIDKKATEMLKMAREAREEANKAAAELARESGQAA